MRRGFRLPWDPKVPKNIDVPVHRDLAPQYPWNWRQGTEWFWALVALMAGAGLGFLFFGG